MNLGQAKSPHAQTALGHNDNIRPDEEFMLREPKKFPDQSLDSITAHGIADFLADRQPKTPGQNIVFPYEDKEHKAL